MHTPDGRRAGIGSVEGLGMDGHSRGMDVSLERRQCRACQRARWAWQLMKLRAGGLRVVSESPCGGADPRLRLRRVRRAIAPARCANDHRCERCRPPFRSDLSGGRQSRGPVFARALRIYPQLRAAAIFTQYGNLPVAAERRVLLRLGQYGGTDFRAEDPDLVHYTQNSPYVAVCIAIHMGARRIGLLGVDFGSPLASMADPWSIHLPGQSRIASMPNTPARGSHARHAASNWST